MADQREDKLKSAREKLDQFRKKMQGSEKVLDVTEPAPAGDGGEKVNENSFVVVKSESEEVVEVSEDVSESSTESLKQLSDQISGLLNQTSQVSKDELKMVLKVMIRIGWWSWSRGIDSWLNFWSSRSWPEEDFRWRLS